MKTGTSGSVSSITSADSRSTVATQHEHRDRDDAAEHELRQVAGEVRLERVDALHRGRRQLAGLRAVERGRLVAQPPLDEREPELRERRRRGPPARDLEHPRERAAEREHDRERDQLARDVRERVAAGGAGDDPRQQRRADEHEQRGREPGGHVDREQRPHRPRAANEARIECGHALPG